MFRDNVFETSETTGTGALTLDGAVTGARTFRSAFGDGPVTVGYVIRNATETGAFETGVGSFAFSAGNSVLTRTTVVESSNSNAAVNWGAGTKNVFCAPIGLLAGGLLSNNKGSNRPAWLQAGGVWIDHDATPWLAYWYDGSDDILLGEINATANVFRTVWKKGADLASAATLVLGSDGDYFDVTGVTGITAITVAAGRLFGLQFDGALTLTHHATNLNLPGGANITTAAGGRLLAIAEATNQVRVLFYTPANGLPVATKDEDTMSSNSDQHVPTQQSVKAYVDAHKGFVLGNFYVNAGTLGQYLVTTGITGTSQPSSADTKITVPVAGTLTTVATTCDEDGTTTDATLKVTINGVVQATLTAIAVPDATDVQTISVAVAAGDRVELELDAWTGAAPDARINSIIFMRPS